MLKKIILILSLYIITVQGQTVDSLKVHRLVSAEELVDSLKDSIKKLENEINNIKVNLVAKSNLDDLVKQYTEASDQEFHDDQKSSHRRIDALLKIIDTQPGKIRFNGGAISVLQSNIKKNTNVSSGVGLIDLFATTGFGGESLFFINFQAKGGNGINNFINPLVTLDVNSGSTQTKEGFDILAVIEAWANFSILDGDFDITAGKLDLTNYFDNNSFANDEYSQFISGSFVNSATLPYLTQSPGIRIRANLLSPFYFQFAVAKEQNSGTNIFKYLNKTIGLGVHIISEENWHNNLRLYVYQSETANNKIGYGFSFDQTLDNDFGLFFRWGKNNNDFQDITNIKSAWSIGASYKTSFKNKALNFGLAYGKNIAFKSRIKSESISEAYSRYNINRWVRMSIHIQNVWNTGGSEESNFLIALRSQIYF